MQKHIPESYADTLFAVFYCIFCFGQFANLVGLRELFLDFNRLSAFPDPLLSLPSLELLGLSHNALGLLPSSIGQLSGLVTLNLSGNALTFVPPELGSLTALGSLDLSRNKLTSLPPELGQLRSLLKLAIDGNAIRPPLAVVVPQGTDAVLAYLRDMQSEQTELQLLSRQLDALRHELEKVLSFFVHPGCSCY